ncbi:Tropomyosin [Popillia japonica]|uniref:Tropomyosin n=1 Tax=Popillia japonica TaxID=7064 RepID=A0AAW1L692_POPJA
MIAHLVFSRPETVFNNRVLVSFIFAMKLEKDNALDRAKHNEQLAKDSNLRAEKAEEEARALQKKIQTIENDLDQTQEQLMQVNAKLEEKEKALQNDFSELV